VELVDPDDAAGVLAVRPGLAAVAGRPPGIPLRAGGEVEDLVGVVAGERDPNGQGTRAVATLNGTLATTRWMVAILENHQRADGSVVVPKALQPFLGLDVLQPV
jgi:hypothetical protein